ncbi:glycosyltransferase family 2 protein [Flavobacterium sp. NRK F10]|uniref:glycosyltransferase family 2 protein n=1 Tax=Flavobacterium sp. NRK F10 TaxID=2954931 RepID=UPI002090DE77|nr:glycosyltransferase family 2 protein [Flavobacterium sp. NRK F10]MCO6174328.1 glycosyltransferase family 2 protein [Flavobacterium sp. NRK F10]
MDIKVAVILVTYNGERWLEKCLKSLQNSIFKVQVIAIDNASTDNSISILKEFDFVELIQSKENLGFGKANNIGIHKAIEAGFEYLFLLNQDTWIYPQTIQNLVLIADGNPDYGIVSPVHFSADEKALDANFEMYWNRKTRAVSQVVDEVPFINAAAWLLPKRVIEKVGYFEPMFSHYGEDRNYSDRVHYHGFKTIVVKNSEICHDRIISRSFQKDIKQSKYKMLAEVLDVNQSWLKAYFSAFRSAIGLPKYFSKFYSLEQTLSMAVQLVGYYVLLKLHFLTIFKARKSYR